MRNGSALFLSVRIEHWPIAGAFTISRGSKREALVVVAELSDGTHRGRGECVPYARYGETVAQVAAAIEAKGPELAAGLDRHDLQQTLPAGAARNALDCAFWDLAAKRAGQRVHELLGEPAPVALTTAYTISLAAPEIMAENAARASGYALLKLKLGSDRDSARVAAVRQAVPHARLIADANEGWTPANIEENLAACARAGVTLVEQPLPADGDHVLAQLRRPIPVCADESARGDGSLAALLGRYDAVNIKLDKAGGLTAALLMARQAEQLGLTLMVGCMVATSLAIAPAMLVAQHANLVDLDGPLLLARDRAEGLHYEGSLVHPPASTLWG